MWYNRRGLTVFYDVAIEPRLEFAAKGRQTPKEVSLWYNRRGMADFWIIEIEPRLEMPARGRASPKTVCACGIIGVAIDKTAFYYHKELSYA